MAKLGIDLQLNRNVNTTTTTKERENGATTQTQAIDKNINIQLAKETVYTDAQGRTHADLKTLNIDKKIDIDIDENKQGVKTVETEETLTV